VPCGGGLTCVAGKQGNVCAHLGETCGGSRDAAADMQDSGAAIPDVREAAVERIVEDAREAGQDAMDVNQLESGVDASDAQDADGAVDIPPDEVIAEDRPDDRDTAGDDTPDASDARDASDATDATDATDAPPPGPCPNDPTSAPSRFCQGGHCLDLSSAMQKGLSLWLDPTNLGPVGTTATIWCDQSGHMNDAYNFDVDSLPQVIPGGLMLPYGTDDAGFVVGNDPSIDFGADDFLILVVAGITHGADGKGIFLKYDGQTTFSKQVTLQWLLVDQIGFRVTGQINDTTGISSMATDAGPIRLYGLRRAADQMEIRINGQIVDSTPLVTSGASTMNDGYVFIGEESFGDSAPVDTLHAAVVIRGSLAPNDVGTLETYLMTAFGI